ncbi:hypothetical protein EGI31_25175 [Lacihabitans soyangensis]|uniref:Uncharacterized protein n=2 Tax=Lacihabitans soyangensis TaxID=869394 RepID=A0AAE3H8J6_9BACT|nr:hypothetical protein [Lacihabitans soyangensis]
MFNNLDLYCMESLLIRPKSKDEMELLREVLKKMKIKSEVIELDSKIRKKNEFLTSLESRILDLEKGIKEKKVFKNAFDLLNEV